MELYETFEDYASSMDRIREINAGAEPEYIDERETLIKKTNYYERN